MDINALLGILLGVGGAGGIGGLVAVYRTIKQGRIADEESIIARQLKELARLEKRAEEAEGGETAMRIERDRAMDQAAYFRRVLISNGFTDVPQLEETRNDRRLPGGNQENTS